MNKKELLKSICEYYNYDLTITEEGKVVIDDGVETNNADFEVLDSEATTDMIILGGHFEYNTVDEALVDWLPTLRETNEAIFETGDVEDEYNTWTEEEINFIEGLK